MGKSYDNWELQRQVWADRRLSLADKAVVLCLIWHRNADTGQCNPAWGTISVESGCNWSTVARAVKRLEFMGWITGERIEGREARWLINGSGVTVTPPPCHCETGQCAKKRRRKPKSANSARAPQERVPGYTDEQWESMRIIMRDKGLEQMRAKTERVQ